MFSSHLVIGITAMASANLFGQAAAGSPTFEVASVKSVNGRPGLTVALNNYPGGRIAIRTFTLKMLIRDAFNLQFFQISGGPRWIDEDLYDIDAKPPASSKSSRSNPVYPETPLDDEQRQMLQMLLIDRYELKFHRETRDGSVYLLLVNSSKKLLLEKPKDHSIPGRVVGLRGGGSSHITGINASMPRFAVLLSRSLERPVIDQTGLKGSFDFDWEYSSDDAPHPDPASLAGDLVRALGLKLEAAKRPAESMVIEHAVKPSGN